MPHAVRERLTVIRKHQREIEIRAVLRRPVRNDDRDSGMFQQLQFRLRSIEIVLQKKDSENGVLFQLMPECLGVQVADELRRAGVKTITRVAQAFFYPRNDIGIGIAGGTVHTGDREIIPASDLS